MFWIFALQFHEGKEYRTVYVYRSALSAVLPLTDGHKAGSHPLICQLLKGVFQLRPPQPRYATTWQVSKVVQYIYFFGIKFQSVHKTFVLQARRIACYLLPQTGPLVLQPVIYALDTFTLKEFSLYSRN